MAKWFLAGSLGVAAIGGGFSPLSAQQVSAEQAMKQADYEKAANEFISLAEEQKWDALYPLLSEDLQSYLTKEQLPQYWSGFTSPYGKINTTSIQSNHYNGVHTKVALQITAEQGSYTLVLNFDSNGKVDDFHTEMATDSKSNY